MTPAERPCLNRGPQCRNLPGHCYTTNGQLNQALLHAHWGMHPTECRVCGLPHSQEPNGLCTRCAARIAAKALEVRADRHRIAVLSNPHLDFTKLTDRERFNLEYEEVA